MNVPSSLKFTKDHEWVYIDGNIATIGITHFAQSELGDIVFVDIPNPTGHFKTHDVFGTVEAVKTVSDLFSPLSGTIVEVNDNLNSNPELVNQDPYGKGWMIKLQLENIEEEKSLLSAAEYEALIG